MQYSVDLLTMQSADCDTEMVTCADAAGQWSLLLDDDEGDIVAEVGVDDNGSARTSRNSCTTVWLRMKLSGSVTSSLTK